VGVIAIVAVVALGAGVALSRFVVSPAELAAAARPPEAGPVTAPIERRVIQNTVTTRADVAYADAVDVKVDTTGLSGPAVVTGRVPEVGSTLEAGSVALEVAGRPLLVLPGALPAYRSLRAGLSGPDVLQLKAALAGLGIDPGDTTSDAYDSATAAAVGELYRRAGYPPPGSGAEVEQQLAAARSAVRGAEAAVEQAGAAVSAAAAGPSTAARVEADNQVREAQRALAAAADAVPREDSLVARLEDELALALARRDDLLKPPPTSAEQASLAAAEQQLDDARADLARAEEEALTGLPSAEVVYLTSLPRRVDAVTAERGSVTSGAALSVSGAELVLEGSASAADAELLAPGAAATFEGADGVEHPATVASVVAQKEGSGADDSAEGSVGGKRFDVVLSPGALTDQERESLKGTNVRVGIPVQSTDGEVLAVPVVALTAGPGGEARIELAPDGEGTGDPPASSDGGGSGSALVEVEAGLSAGGFVEIRTTDPRVRAGARVVVGR
jgi:peptidoglycan hydrolase-like protein with peptidoglycan-binding domain